MGDDDEAICVSYAAFIVFLPFVAYFIIILVYMIHASLHRQQNKLLSWMSLLIYIVSFIFVWKFDFRGQYFPY